MNYWSKKVELAELNGKIVKEIKGLEKGSDEVDIFTECGNHYRFYHSQDCCECVDLNDFDGDPLNLVGALIISAEEVSGDEPEEEEDSYIDSQTWTFYKIETNKGGIWMRWLGESNGYYSEEVDFIWVNKPESE